MFMHTFLQKCAWLARLCESYADKIFVNLMLIDFCESYADKENYTWGSRCIYVCDFQGIVLFT